MPYDELDEKMGLPKPQNTDAPVDDNNTDTQDEAPIVEAAAAPATPIVADEEAVAIAVYNRKKGTNFKSFDEIDAAAASPAEPTETDEEKRKRRQKEKFKFGLENNIFTVEERDAFVRDSGRPARDLVYDNFYRERKAAGDTDAAIELKFTRLYGEDLDEEDEADTEKVSSFVKERRANDLKREAARLLKKKYPNLHSLDNKFEAHEAQTKTTQQKQREKEQFAARYRDDVKKVLGEIKPQKFGFQHDKESFETEFNYKPEVLKQIEKEFLTEASMSAFTTQYSPEVLQNAIAYRLKELSFNDITTHVAKTYAKQERDKKKIVRNHLTTEDVTGAGAAVREYDELDVLLDLVPKN